MRRKILYNILNEWRDEDMDDSPIDLDDDMNIEPTSSDMSDEPDLDDDDFALSNITSNKSDYIILSDEILLKKGYCPYSLEDPFHYDINELTEKWTKLFDKILNHALLISTKNKPYWSNDSVLNDCIKQFFPNIDISLLNIETLKGKNLHTLGSYKVLNLTTLNNVDTNILVNNTKYKLYDYDLSFVIDYKIIRNKFMNLINSHDAIKDNSILIFNDGINVDTIKNKEKLCFCYTLRNSPLQICIKFSGNDRGVGYFGAKRMCVIEVIKASMFYYNTKDDVFKIGYNDEVSLPAYYTGYIYDYTLSQNKHIMYENVKSIIENSICNLLYIRLH